MPGIDETENQFRFRIEDPDKFSEFRTKEFGKGVSGIFGKYKGKNEWGLQALRFDKDKFKTKEEVRKWLKEHGYLKSGYNEFIGNVVFKSFDTNSDTIEFIGTTTDITGGTGISEDALDTIISKHNDRIARWKQGDITAKPIVLTDKFNHEILSLRDIIGHVDRLEKYKFISPIDNKEHTGIKVTAKLTNKEIDKNAIDYTKFFSIAFKPIEIDEAKTKSSDGDVVFSDIEIQHFAITPKPVDPNSILLSKSLLSSILNESLQEELNMQEADNSNKEITRATDTTTTTTTTATTTATETLPEEVAPNPDGTCPDGYELDKSRNICVLKSKKAKDTDTTTTTTTITATTPTDATNIPAELKSQIETLKAENELLKDQIIKSEVSQKVEYLIQKGSVTPAQRDIAFGILYKSKKLGLFDELYGFLTTIQQIDKSQIIPEGGYIISQDTRGNIRIEDIQSVLPPEIVERIKASRKQ